MVLPLLLALAAAKPAIVAKSVEYTAPDGTVCEGYVAYDANMKGKRPVVLIVHDWDGLDSYEQRRAREMAELGYVGFAVDVYGKGVRPQGADRGKTAGKYAGNPTLFRERLKAGYDAATAMMQADKSDVAAIGYCFGGGGVLQMGRAGLPLKALIPIHGSLSASPEDKNFKGATLILHGAEDPYTPAAKARELEASLEKYGKPVRLVLYPGAVHAFTVPDAGSDKSTGAAYDAKADRESFAEMRGFLKKHLGR